MIVHERNHCCYLNHEIKYEGHRTCVCGRDAESAHHLHSFRFLIKDWGGFQNGMFIENH